MMRVQPGNCQHIGARSSQQDAFGFSDKDDLDFVAHGGVLAVVADGMGGMACGGEASHRAVQAFLRDYMAKPASETVPSALLQALHVANQAVVDMADQLGLDDVGTTLVAAAIHGAALHWVAAGDSRLYLLRQEQLTQLTEDHVMAVALDRDAANGLISPQEAQDHPERLALTSYLGQMPLDLIDQNPAPMQLLEGDKILLCSDGFYAALEPAEFLAYATQDPQTMAEELVSIILAKNRSGQDNLTVAVLLLGEHQQG